MMNRGRRRRRIGPGTGAGVYRSISTYFTKPSFENKRKK